MALPGELGVGTENQTKAPWSSFCVAHDDEEPLHVRHRRRVVAGVLGGIPHAGWTPARRHSTPKSSADSNGWGTSLHRGTEVPALNLRERFLPFAWKSIK